MPENMQNPYFYHGTQEAENATRQQATIIGGLLLIHPSDSSWTILWPIIENNIEIGKEIVVYAARKSSRRGKDYRKIS